MNGFAVELDDLLECNQEIVTFATVHATGRARTIRASLGATIRLVAVTPE